MERIEEEEEHRKVTKGGEGFIEVLLDAGEMIARLEARLKMITRRTGGQTDKRGQEQSYSLSQRSEPADLKINLPKLQLPTFDSNIQHWQEFWMRTSHRFMS